MGEDPYIPNYDPAAQGHPQLLQRQSRGPLLRKATALDWAGDPIEVEGRFDAGARRDDLRGDARPLPRLHRRRRRQPRQPRARRRSASTAYALTGEAEVPRLAARVRRRLGASAPQQNGGLIPTQRRAGRHDRERLRLVRRRLRLGLHRCCRCPATGKLAHRAYHTRTPYSLRQRAAADRRPRATSTSGGEMFDLVNANAKEEDGQTLYPHMYGRLTGWSGCSGASRSTTCRTRGRRLVRVPAAASSRPSAQALYYWTLDRSALDLLPARRRAGCATWTARTPATPRRRCSADLESAAPQGASGCAADTARRTCACPTT